MDIHNNIERPLVKDWSFYNKKNECVSASAPTGMGNAQPPASASMSWAQQTSDSTGSGDRWDNKTSKPKKTKVKVSNIKTQNEAENVNPYDKIGNLMLDKLKIPSIFDKHGNDGIISKTEKKHRIAKLK